MVHSDDTVCYVYYKTNGHCRYCGKKLSLNNYGAYGCKGAWEIDHSIPVCKGGTNHINNLFAACVVCNNKKGDMAGRDYLRLFRQ